MLNDHLHTTLAEPTRPLNILPNAKWLSGEGAGSWFHIEKVKEYYIITRLSPEGKIECKGSFILASESNFEMDKAYKITYLSHCSLVTVIQNEIKHQFKLREKCD